MREYKMLEVGDVIIPGDEAKYVENEGLGGVGTTEWAIVPPWMHGTKAAPANSFRRPVDKVKEAAIKLLRKIDRHKVSMGAVDKQIKALRDAIKHCHDRSD